MFDPHIPGIPGIDTEEDRQVFLIYAILTSNAQSARAWPATQELMIHLAERFPTHYHPFDYIKECSEILVFDLLVRTRIGQYTNKSRALKEAAELPVSLKVVSLETLEGIHNVGPKTARFFAMYAQRRDDVAPLDTHILKFLRDMGHTKRIHTPPAGDEYRRLELAFIDEARKRGESPIDFDFRIWAYYRDKTRKKA